MRNKLGGICLLTALVVSSLAAPLFAGNAKAFKRTVLAPRYEASKEVTLEGTIQGLVRKPAPGTMMGAHLTVSTSKGTIDAHIGDFILRGSHAYAPAAGQSVKLVGVMTTINNKSVFLTRTVETGNRTIQVRNDRGYLILPGTMGKIAKTKVSTTGGAL
jgi:hypothetical protein